MITFDNKAKKERLYIHIYLRQFEKKFESNLSHITFDNGIIGSQFH